MRKTNAPGSGRLPRASKKVQRSSGTKKYYQKTAGCTRRKCFHQNLPPHVHGPGVLDRLKTYIRKTELARQSHHLKRNLPGYSQRITQAVLFGVQNGRRP